MEHPCSRDSASTLEGFRERESPPEAPGPQMGRAPPATPVAGALSERNARHWLARAATQRVVATVALAVPLSDPLCNLQGGPRRTTSRLPIRIPSQTDRQTACSSSPSPSRLRCAAHSLPVLRRHGRRIRNHGRVRLGHQQLGWPAAARRPCDRLRALPQVRSALACLPHPSLHCLPLLWFRLVEVCILGFGLLSLRLNPLFLTFLGLGFSNRFMFLILRFKSTLLSIFSILVSELCIVEP